jgi:hypothetical protein
VGETVFEIRDLSVERLRLEANGAAVSDLAERCCDYTMMITGERAKWDSEAEFFKDIPGGQGAR